MNLGVTQFPETAIMFLPLPLLDLPSAENSGSRIKKYQPLSVYFDSKPFLHKGENLFP
jgi:hypothetical protein